MYRRFFANDAPAPVAQRPSTALLRATRPLAVPRPEGNTQGAFPGTRRRRSHSVEDPFSVQGRVSQRKARRLMPHRRAFACFVRTASAASLPRTVWRSLSPMHYLLPRTICSHALSAPTHYLPPAVCRGFPCIRRRQGHRLYFVTAIFWVASKNSPRIRMK